MAINKMALLLMVGGVIVAVHQVQCKDAPTIANPSFEEGNGVPNDWAAIQGNTKRPALGSVLSWDREFAHTGKRSVYLRKNSIGILQWRTRQAIAVAPGANYKVSVWYKLLPGANGSFGISVSAATRERGVEPWGVSQKVEMKQTPSEEWQQKSMEFQVPENVSSIQISLTNTSSGRKEGEINDIWFDDVSIEQIATEKEAQ